MAELAKLCDAAPKPQSKITENELHLREILLDTIDIAVALKRVLLNVETPLDPTPEILCLRDNVEANVETARQIRETLLYIRENL